jgi:outer membrane lipase/esterase
MNISLPRASCPLAVLLLTSLLAACGGGGDVSTPADIRNIKEVVSFGDSLSDVGTYNPTTADADLTNDQPLGLRFTTKPILKVAGKPDQATPGAVWVDLVAAAYDLNITANRQVSFSGINPLTGAPVGTPGVMGTIYQLGGNGYAEGGARIETDTLDAQGKPTDGLITVKPGLTYQSATALSIKGQIAKYKAARTSFNSSQLVLLQGGPNDFFAFFAKVGAGAFGDPRDVANLPAIKAAADAETAKNVKAMVAQVNELLNTGATHILYSNMPDLGVTPQFKGTALAALASAVSQGYNDTVKNVLAKPVADKKLVIFDTATLVNTAIAQPALFKLSNVDQMACNSATPTGVSALVCNAKTLVAANADVSYLFADSVHPTVTGHGIWASEAVKAAMKVEGFGK